MIDTPEKAKDWAKCPSCESKAEPASDYPDSLFLRCSNQKCDFHLVLIHAAQWNRRPREDGLEKVLSDVLKRAQGRLRVHWNSAEQLSRGTVKECVCADCETFAANVAAINSALEEK